MPHLWQSNASMQTDAVRRLAIYLFHWAFPEFPHLFLIQHFLCDILSPPIKWCIFHILSFFPFFSILNSLFCIYVSGEIYISSMGQRKNTKHGNKQAHSERLNHSQLVCADRMWNVSIVLKIPEAAKWRASLSVLSQKCFFKYARQAVVFLLS